MARARPAGAVTTSSPERARVALLVHFLCLGSMLGVWAARLPAVKRGLRIDDGDIGLVLFVAAIGALLSLRAAGRLIERFGSRRTTQVAGVAATASFALAAAAGNLAALAFALLAMGLTQSLEDVAMNSQAVAVEQRTARPIMSSFHAAFSLGGIAGAAVGALTAKFDVSYRSTFAVTSAVLVASVLAANRALLDGPETQRRPRDVERDRSRLPERRALLALGVIGFVSFIAEGAAADWTTIYLRDNTGASAATAAVGFVAFSVTMTAGRLGGDRVAARYGALPLIRLGTGVAGAGLLLAVAIGTTAAGFVGFALLGIGLSIVVPQVFSAAGAIAPDRAATALSFVSSIAYVGFLAGPAAIGAVSRQLDLRVALLIPATLVLAGSVVADRLHASNAGSPAGPALDVAAYLARLGVRHDGPPSVQRLTALHAAHVEQVPYETVEIHLGRPTSINGIESARRIVELRRGGYCFHLNGAFAELLTALGYDVVRHRGHVRSVDEQVLPEDDPNHLALTVRGLPSAESPAGGWLVDVGLGEGFAEPLPLVPGVYQRGGFEYAVARLDDETGWVYRHDPRGSFKVMLFGDPPATTRDFEASHHQLSMAPDSGFAKLLAVERRDRDGLTQLHGCILKRVTGLGQPIPPLVEVETADEWFELLRERFGLPLDDVDAAQRAALWRRVRAAHDAWDADGRP